MTLPGYASRVKKRHHLVGLQGLVPKTKVEPTSAKLRSYPLEGLCQKDQRFCVPQRTGAYGSGIGLLSLPLHRLAGALCLLDFAMFQKHFHGLPDRELAGDNSFPA
jgi:hypothetical protein